MAKAFNPFEHHHDHDHDHDHLHEELADPAQRALGDALRVSFRILKWVMCIMILGYLFSGFFQVKTQEQAVRLRFGKIVTDEHYAPRVYMSSGRPHWAAPYPFEEVIRVPTSERTIDLNRQFWYQRNPGETRTEQELAAQRARMPLNPEREGSLLTGDANIVQSQWTVRYEIDDPALYIEKVGSDDIADALVRVAAERAIVHAIGQLEADQFVLRSERAEELAKKMLQETLNAHGCGIKINSMTCTKGQMPLAVLNALQLVILAENERAQAVEAAQQEWSRILGETAGEAHRPLWQLLQQYEDAADRGESERLAELDGKLALAFQEMVIDGVSIGGRVAEVINEAHTYRTQVVERVKSEARQFELLLPQYRLVPRIVLSRHWERTKQEILTGDIETFYLPAGQTWLDLNRDPKIQRARDQERLRQERMHHSE